jgi:predicted transcriptional regulator
MEIYFDPQFEAQLKRAAVEDPPSNFVQEILEAYLDHEKWFRAEVQKGLAQLDNEESVSNDEMTERVERMFRS